MIATDFHDVVGQQVWNPTPVNNWLAEEGRQIVRVNRLLAQLGVQLRRAGAPICRLKVSLPTLNPAVSRYSYTWWQGDEKATVVKSSHDIDRLADYTGSPVEAVRESGQAYRKPLHRLEPTGLHPILRELAEQGVSDYLVLPLRFTFEQKAIPWILATDRQGGFTESDIASFESIARVLAPILEVLAQRATTRSLLNTYLGKRTGQKVLDGQVTRGDGELIEAVIWYSDMRSSTALAEALNHRQLLDLLNRYFQIVSDAVVEQGGEVLRFVGDALLVVFPGDQFKTLGEAGEAALAAAQSVHYRAVDANLQLQQQGLQAIRYGVGLDVGPVIYGNVGAEERLDFTVMGSAVNRAARIEGLTKIAKCSLLVSESLAQLLGQRLRWKGAYPVQGVEHPLSVYCARCEYQDSGR